MASNRQTEIPVAHSAAYAYEKCQPANGYSVCLPRPHPRHRAGLPETAEDDVRNVPIIWLSESVGRQWRRGRDSNPRSLTARRFSRPTPSTARTPLHNGAHGGVRTLDLRLKRPLLYQLSYTSIWCQWQESNLHRRSTTGYPGFLTLVSATIHWQMIF